MIAAVKIAAHHLNCVVSLTDRRPTCEADWQAYNDAIDRLDERKRGAQP